VACLLTCTGPGKDGCVECKAGYEHVNGSCEGKVVHFYCSTQMAVSADVDECEADEDKCDLETEMCDNLPGTFMCKCKPGHEKVDGKCVVVKKPKKKKTSPKSRKPNNAKPTTEGNEREHYSFFHILGPLLISLGIYKYTEPNLTLSCSLIVAIVMTILLY